MSFHPTALTAADQQALAARFESALREVTGKAPLTPPLPWFEALLGTPGQEAASQEKVRAFETLTNPVSRQLFWRLLGSQMNMGIGHHDALEQMKAHDFRNAFPNDMPQLVETWQTALKNGEKDFFLRHVAPVDFQQGMRMWIVSQTTSLGDAIRREGEGQRG